MSTRPTPPPAAPQGARRRLSADDRRDEIVVAARRLFADQGYHATTTRELARAAGVSDALLYRHFGSKREVLDQVVTQALAAFGATPPLERLSDLPVDALLRTIGAGFLERVDANLDLLTLLIGEHGEVSDARFAEFIDRAATGLGGELARRIPGLGPDEGYLAARSFFGSLIAFALLQRVLGMDRVRATEPGVYLDHAVRRALAGR